jgi:hypothetical protein
MTLFLNQDESLARMIRLSPVRLVVMSEIKVVILSLNTDALQGRPKSEQEDGKMNGQEAWPARQVGQLKAT